MKRRQFIAGASAAVTATAIGLPVLPLPAAEIASDVMFSSPKCVGYSVGRNVVLQIGDGLGNWKTIENLKTLVLDTIEFA